MAGDDASIGVDQDWVVETEIHDAGGDLGNLRVRVGPGVAGKRYEFVDQPQLDMPMPPNVASLGSRDSYGDLCKIDYMAHTYCL